jgi:hypothetical protein
MSSVYPFSGFLDSDDKARGSRITITVVCPISDVQLKIPGKLCKLPVNRGTISRYQRPFEYCKTRKTDKQTTFVFFVEMARFASLSDSDLDKILEDHDSKNTKSVIKLAVKVLNDYLIEKNGEITSVDELDLSDTSVDIVVATLKRFTVS